MKNVSVCFPAGMKVLWRIANKEDLIVFYAFCRQLMKNLWPF